LTDRFEQFEDIERVVIWQRDQDDGIIKAAELQGEYVTELNGELLVVEEQ